MYIYSKTILLSIYATLSQFLWIFEEYNKLPFCRLDILGFWNRSQNISRHCSGIGTQISWLKNVQLYFRKLKDYKCEEKKIKTQKTKRVEGKGNKYFSFLYIVRPDTEFDIRPYGGYKKGCIKYIYTESVYTSGKPAIRFMQAPSLYHGPYVDKAWSDKKISRIENIIFYFCIFVY